MFLPKREEKLQLKDDIKSFCSSKDPLFRGLLADFFDVNPTLHGGGADSAPLSFWTLEPSILI